MIKREKIKKILPITLVIIFSALICYTFPLTGDDYGKGANLLIEGIKGAYSLWLSYNGRFLGNVLVDLINYSKIFRIFVQTGVITGIIYLVYKSSNSKAKLNTFLLSFVLFFGMSIMMFREAISWMSGFANFGIPALMFALLIYNFRNIFEDDKVEYKWYHYLIAVLCGIFTNLFSEHTSIFSVLIGIGFIIVSLINHKKIYKIQIVYLIVSIICCALMFLSPVYWNGMPRLNNADYYNSLNVFQKLYYNLRTSTWMENMVFDNILLNGIISISFLKRFKKSNKVLKTLNIILIFLSICIFPLISFNDNLFNIRLLDSKKLQFLLVAFYFIAITVLIVKNFNFKKSLQLICYFLGAFVAAAPLLLAYGIGPRCFFTSYVLLMFFTMLLLTELNVFNKITKYILSFMTLMIVIVYGIVYGSNYKIYQERNEILSKVDENQMFISLPKYPYPYFIHQSGTPGYGGYHYQAYLLYYHLNPDAYIDFYDKESEALYTGYIITPTYDGSGQATHPSIIKLDEEISGYKYWMALTPWPNNQNKYENPSILASNNGIDWVEPEGIKNPISDPIEEGSYDYYSDPYLYFKDSTFRLLYRYNPYQYDDVTSSTLNNLLLEKTSEDGIHWSETKLIFDKEEEQAFMSPSYVEKENIERIYYVNYDANIYYKEKEKDGWSNSIKVNTGELNETIWHVEFKIVDNVYIMLAFADNKLYIASSLDGINFENSQVINIPRLELQQTSSEEYKRVYKSSVLFEEDKVSFYVPYNIKTEESSVWGIFLYQEELENYNWLFEVK